MLPNCSVQLDSTDLSARKPILNKQCALQYCQVPKVHVTISRLGSRNRG